MYTSHDADVITASQLVTVLDQHAPAVLSLDCFDTLLWRETALPVDVFFKLQTHPVFQAAGLTAPLRISAEARARQLKLFHQQGNEVSLTDIYRAHRSSLTAAELKSLAEVELATEMETCFAFPPTVALIRAAAKRHIPVVIVSDTYFSEAELRALLAYALPDDVMQAIQQVFCSSAYGHGKMHGLFQDVLQRLKQPADQVLHIGDNLAADYIAARQLNLRALHFRRESELQAERSRLQTIAASIVDPAIRSERPLYHPFRGVLAAHESSTHMGYATLGPLLYTFARYLQTEITDLTTQGKTPKVLFLLRDAYLPAMACETLNSKPQGVPVRISRFTAFATSFRTCEDIDRYLLTVMPSQRFQDVVRQLLLPPKVAEPLIKSAEQHKDPVSEFLRLIHRKDIQTIIFTKSTEYRARFLQYLDKTITLTPGDTLLFVDLGYSGTAQQLLTPLFAEKGIQVEGRYLISITTPDPNSPRQGMINDHWCDPNVMRMIVSHIALLEQLCTTNEKSVVDFDATGQALYSDVAMQATQQDSLTQIQAECLRFITDASRYFAALPRGVAWPLLREASLIELVRMIFLPTAAEIQMLQGFQFDVNLGTTDLHHLFDLEKGFTGLRRRGLFYMEKNVKTKRTNYPYELRAAGFELALTAMIQNRLGLEITPQDLLSRRLPLEALLFDGRTTDKVMLEATATHDGYYTVWAPLGAAVAFNLGKHYQWLQLDCAELIELEAFIHQQESQQQQDVMPLLRFEQSQLQRGGLVLCERNGSIQLHRDASIPAQEWVLRLVFRPLVEQEKLPEREQTGMRVAFSIST